MVCFVLVSDEARRQAVAQDEQLTKFVFCKLKKRIGLQGRQYFMVYSGDVVHDQPESAEVWECISHVMRHGRENIKQPISVDVGLQIDRMLRLYAGNGKCWRNANGLYSWLSIKRREKSGTVRRVVVTKDLRWPT